jgi:hypothetical protein
LGVAGSGTPLGLGSAAVGGCAAVSICPGAHERLAACRS